MRDPRVNPEPGDVLRKNGIERTVTGIILDHKRTIVVIANEPTDLWFSLAKYRAEAAGAEVLNASR